METRKIKITGISSLLGSTPASKEVFARYLATKAPTELETRALEDVEYVREQEEEKATQFFRNKEGEIILLDYQIKGFLKEALNVLKGSLGITAAKSKADNLVFIKGREIPIVRNGERLCEADELLERPLRAMTMQGPRVALARSEMLNIDNGAWEAEFSITLLDDTTGGKSKKLSWEAIEEALNYGSLKGLLQWRNGGYGSFEWEYVD